MVLRLDYLFLVNAVKMVLLKVILNLDLVTITLAFHFLEHLEARSPLLIFSMEIGTRPINQTL